MMVKICLEAIAMKITASIYCTIGSVMHLFNKCT